MGLLVLIASFCEGKVLRFDNCNPFPRLLAEQFSGTIDPSVSVIATSETVTL